LVCLIARLHKHPQIVTRSQRQSANRLDDGVRRETQADSLRKRRDAENRFGETERSTGADAGPDAKGQVGVPDTELCVLGKKSVGDVVIGLAPISPVPVQQPRYDHDKRACRDLAASDNLVVERLPREKRNRRIEPYRLVENRPRVDQPRNVIERRWAATKHLCELVVEAFFHFRSL